MGFLIRYSVKTRYQIIKCFEHLHSVVWCDASDRGLLLPPVSRLWHSCAWNGVTRLSALWMTGSWWVTQVQTDTACAYRLCTGPKGPAALECIPKSSLQLPKRYDLFFLSTMQSGPSYYCVILALLMLPIIMAALPHVWWCMQYWILAWEVGSLPDLYVLMWRVWSQGCTTWNDWVKELQWAQGVSGKVASWSVYYGASLI